MSSSSTIICDKLVFNEKQKEGRNIESMIFMDLWMNLKKIATLHRSVHAITAREIEHSQFRWGRQKSAKRNGSNGKTWERGVRRRTAN